MLILKLKNEIRVKIVKLYNIIRNNIPKEHLIALDNNISNITDTALDIDMSIDELFTYLYSVCEFHQDKETEYELDLLNNWLSDIAMDYAFKALDIKVTHP